MRHALPILEHRERIAQTIRAHRVVIVCGETGSGKTTQLPQICHEMGLSGAGLIGHTQPRRLAARAVAARIAEEMGVAVGGLVGVKVRFQDRTGRDTRIKLMTDGMLLAELGADPGLQAYSTIIIDEAHERSLNVDFLLGYLRGLLEQRTDLKVIVTSATIDPARFSAYFGGPEAAPVIEVSGRMYPVEVRYRPAREDEDDPAHIDYESVADAVEELTRTGAPRGDVLVFLPGEREIRLAGDALRRRAGGAGALEVMPLFARLTTQEQDRIFHPSPGRQRVILATNIAETSLTVPGIRYVVDTGLARLSRYDPERKVLRLPIEPVSRASADQRSGRCGRVAEGVCIRMYSERSYESRPLFTDPEIKRTNLASVVLQMKSLGLAPIDHFPFLDPPDERATADAHETLFELGATDSPARDSALTPVGRDLARLPLDPRVGRMLLAAEREGSLREVLVLAAALSIQDPRERPMQRQDAADRAQLVFRNETSDFLTLLNIWDQFTHAASGYGAADLRAWCHDRFVSAARMREWAETVRQLRSLADELGMTPNKVPASPDAIHRALLTGLISNVACRAGDGSFEYRGVRGNAISIFPGSALFKKAPKWIMAAEVVHTTRLYGRTVAKITIEWMEELAAHMFEHRLSDRYFDVETGEPSAWERVSMSGIVVVPRRRTALAPRDAGGARRLFIEEGLARMKWRTEETFMRHNREVIDEARQAEARLRRRGLVRPDDELAAWFEARVPESVYDPATFQAWWEREPATSRERLCLSLADVLRPDAASALDEAAFPSSLALDGGDGPIRCPLEYALAPGKDDDGVTTTVLVSDLPALTPTRAAWLVPGMLMDVVAALLKTLPKQDRAKLDARGGIDAVAGQCSAVMTFGAGALPESLSEALGVLLGVEIKPELLVIKALPPHLRLRVRVVDERGVELAAGRDLGELMARFQGRIERARAAAARAATERGGIVAWDFGELAETAIVERAGETVEMYPALLDAGVSARLTLLESAGAAARETRFGVRRLLALECRGEVEPLIESGSEWHEMTRHYQQLGTVPQLLDELVCIIVDRAFLAGRPLPRSREQFNARLQECRGRLAPVSHEVTEAVSRVLAARAKVAQRLSGGTPRLWADSVADIREHAAYLMPLGFLRHLEWERLRRYPRWVEAMRERLFALREGGSGIEKEALRTLGPHWKRFTAWVAAGMAAERTADASEGQAPQKKASAKSPLPQTRRNSPVINVDAGVWALTPGNLPASVEEYRWALEDARVAVFSGGDAGAALQQLDALWARVEPARRRGERP